MLVHIRTEFLRKDRAAHDGIVEKGKRVAEPGFEAFDAAAIFNNIEKTFLVKDLDIVFQHHVLHFNDQYILVLPNNEYFFYR